MDELISQMNQLSAGGGSIFSFAESLSDEELEQEEEERLQEIDEIVKEVKEQAKTQDNASLPEFIWTPVVNIFEDCQDYIERAMCCHLDVLRAVTNMPTKYRDYFDYLDALERWHDYYDWITEEYGSWKNFQELAEEGLVTIPVIKEPQLKRIPENRGLKKLKYALSRVDPAGGPPKEFLKSIIDAIPPAIEPYEDEQEYYEKLSHFNDEDIRQAQAASRVRSLRRIDSRMQIDSRSDAIMQFLNRDAFSGIDGLGKPKSFAEEIEGLHEYDGLDQEVIEDMQTVRAYGYEHRARSSSIILDSQHKMLVDQRDKDVIEVYEALSRAGWSVDGMIDGSNMDKKRKRMIKRNLGLNAASGKDIKRLKKQRKKREKANEALKARLQGDARTRDMLMHSKVAYDRNDDALSFTIDSILQTEE